MPTGQYVRIKGKIYGGFKKGHKFFGDLSKPNYFKVGEHKGIEFKKGDKKSLNWKKITTTLVGEKRYNWKGDNVSYSPLHIWVKKHKGSPKSCEHCGVKGRMLKRFWSIDWANIDHKYRRVLEDYIGLCKKCHSQYDKKYNNKHFYGTKNK